MSLEPNQRPRRFSRLDAHIVVTALAVGLAALALFVALRIDNRVELRTEDGVSQTDAEAILERANDAVTFADSILSFLEGASVVVGAILAVGAWMLRNSIQNQIEATNEFVQRAEREFQEREASLKALEASLKQQLEDMIVYTRDQLGEAQARAQDAFRVLSLLVLAEQQIRDHNIDTALSTLEDAQELDPDNQATNYLLGYLYTTRKQFDEAIDRLERTLQTEPNFAPAIAALGLALRRKGDGMADQPTQRAQLWAQSEAKLLDALARDPHLTDADGESYYGTLGGLYRRQGRYQDALDAYGRAHRVRPNSSYPIVNLATLHKHEGHDEQAADFFRRVIRAAELQLDDDPRDYWTRADFAQARLVLGQVEDAKKELRTVIDSVQERGLLESMRSGLLFLAESPGEIPGLDDMVGLLNDAIAALDKQAQANPEQEAADL